MNRIRMVENRSYMRKVTIQLTMAILLVLSGIVLIFSGFWIAPAGEIHNSVLVAFGEVSTFAGALFGVDYSYKLKIDNRNLKTKEDERDNQ